MSVINIPVGLKVAGASWGQHRNDIVQGSSFGAQAFEGSAPLWITSFGAPTLKEQNSGQWQVLLLQLRGYTNQLALHNLIRPVPLGSMRGAMTFNAAAVLGATSLSIIAAGQAGKTLLQGDYLGVGAGLTQQVVMVTADAVANGAGVIVVETEPPLRNAFGAAAVVVWDKPKALFRRASSGSQWRYQRQRMSGFAIDLIENVQP